ncbi:hypothetical protein M885DRAFT_609699 [Pelagophyceae sp. CCMP2097]|nr:hypothetical protein M885DRAFT_609699 [Pelagophyceae sp. CCMP2097]
MQYRAAAARASPAPLWPVKLLCGFASGAAACAANGFVTSTHPNSTASPHPADAASPRDGADGAAVGLYDAVSKVVKSLVDGECGECGEALKAVDGDHVECRFGSRFAKEVASQSGEDTSTVRSGASKNGEARGCASGDESDDEGMHMDDESSVEDFGAPAATAAPAALAPAAPEIRRVSLSPEASAAKGALPRPDDTRRPLETSEESGGNDGAPAASVASPFDAAGGATGVGIATAAARSECSVAADDGRVDIHLDDLTDVDTKPFKDALFHPPQTPRNCDDARHPAWRRPVQACFAAVDGAPPSNVPLNVEPSDVVPPQQPSNAFAPLDSNVPQQSNGVPLNVEPSDVTPPQQPFNGTPLRVEVSNAVVPLTAEPSDVAPPQQPSDGVVPLDVELSDGATPPSNGDSEGADVIGVNVGGEIFYASRLLFDRAPHSSLARAVRGGERFFDGDAELFPLVLALLDTALDAQRHEANHDSLSDTLNTLGAEQVGLLADELEKFGVLEFVACEQAWRDVAPSWASNFQGGRNVARRIRSAAPRSALRTAAWAACQWTAVPVFDGSFTGPDSMEVRVFDSSFTGADGRQMDVHVAGGWTMFTHAHRNETAHADKPGEQARRLRARR